MAEVLQAVRLAWDLWREVEEHGTAAYDARKISEAEYWLLRSAFPTFCAHKWMQRDAARGEFDKLTKALIAGERAKEPQVETAKKQPDRLNQEELRRV